MGENTINDTDKEIKLYGIMAFVQEGVKHVRYTWYLSSDKILRY